MMNLYEKILKVLGLVRYKDFELCRDALDKCVCMHEDLENDLFVGYALYKATYICDYPDITDTYPKTK